MRNRPTGDVRGIEEREVEAWCACPSKEGEPGHEAWVAGERAWVRRWHPTARNLFACARGREFAGKWDLPMEDRGHWTLWAPSVRRDADAPATMAALCAHVRDEAARRAAKDLEVLLEEAHPARELARAALLAAGFGREETRVLVRRDLRRPLPEDAPAADVGRAAGTPLHVLRTLCAGVGGSERTWDALEHDERARSSSLVLRIAGEPVGLAALSSHPGDDLLLLGYLGLLPAARGRGLGRALWAAVLREGRASGATAYIGSTVEGNAAMRRVFEWGGCERFARRWVFFLDRP